MTWSRLAFAFLFIVFLSMRVFAQNLIGVVQTPSREAVRDVQVSIIGVGTAESDKKGRFRIKLPPSRRPGTRINLQVSKQGWRVANPQILSTDVRDDYIAHPLIIEMVRDSSQLPVLKPDTRIIQANSAVDINVLANDSVLGGGVTNVTQGEHGAVIKLNNGLIRYTPQHDFSGKDTFTYTVVDRVKQTSTTNVTVTVLPPASLAKLKVIIYTLTDDKDREESVVITVYKGPDILGESKYEDKYWDKNTMKEAYVTLNTKIPVYESNQLSVRFQKHPKPGKKAKGWHMSFEVIGILPNGRGIKVLDKTEMIKLGKGQPDEATRNLRLPTPQ